MGTRSGNHDSKMILKELFGLARYHMAGGVAVPLKPKTKIVWGKRPHLDDEGDVDPGASSSGQPRTEQAPR